MKIRLFQEARLKNAIIKNNVKQLMSILSMRDIVPDIHIHGDSAVIYAIKNDKFNVASVLIGRGANIIESDIDNYTALHYALINDNTPFYIIRSLVTHGADVNASSFIGRTPLQLACINGDLDTMIYLIKNGADRSATDMFGNTLMHMACMNNYNHIIEYLINKDFDLYAKNYRGVVAFDLLKMKTYATQTLNETDNKYLSTPLRTDSIRNLVKNNKTNVPKRNMSLDISKNQSSISNGHKINSQNLNTIVEQDPNSESKKTLSKLAYEACKSGNVKYLNYLIDYGVNIKERDLLDSNIFLNIACKNNDIKMIKFLVDKGLNIYEKNIITNAPIDLLRPSTKKVIVSYLYEKNKDLISTYNLDMKEILYITNNVFTNNKLNRSKTLADVELLNSNNSKTSKNLLRSISFNNIFRKHSNLEL